VDDSNRPAIPSLEEVIAQLQSITGAVRLPTDVRIADLGTDSMDLLQWLFQLEANLGIELDELLGDDTELDAFGDLTLAELYDALHPLISASLARDV
jgi:hypothetical protein